MTLPLDDVRVLDVTVARAGPTAVRQLADWGAQVIRVEPPPGDAHDELAGARSGSDFQNLHRNKRSLTLDLKQSAGREVFYRLVDQADVLVENWRPPVKARLGVDYDTLSARNPRLIYGSISGFGQHGPYAERGGVDQIAQGLGGLMSITGLPGQGPVRVGIPVADLSAGLYLAIGILTALHDRARTGRGRWVQTSLLEAMVAMLDFQATRWSIDGEVPPQAGNDHPTGIPMGCFATSDGHVNIAASGGRLWRRFCEALAVPEWLDDPRFRSAKLRSANREQLNELIAARLVQHRTAQWVALLTEHGVPVGPVNDIAEVFADPQVQHLGLLHTVEHGRLGPLDLVRNAVTMSDGSGGVPAVVAAGDAAGAPATLPTVRQPSPDLGQHAEQVLAEAGFSVDEIAGLRAANVI